MLVLIYKLNDYFRKEFYMNKKNQYEDRLVKTVGDKEKINMTPIVENITKLVGAVVIVIMF